MIIIGVNNNNIEWKIISKGLIDSKLGCPYVWGASGPNTFDCSGLVMWCYAQAGVSLEAISEALTHSDKEITKTYVNIKDKVNRTVGDIAFRSLKN